MKLNSLQFAFALSYRKLFSYRYDSGVVLKINLIIKYTYLVDVVLPMKQLSL